MESGIELFRGKNIFITGATGFMGKVLLEKLLRSLDVGNIYVLIRPKKGKDPNERIKEITDVPLFDVLKGKCPENLKKIVPVVGDCTKLGLGISLSDLQELQEKVSVVFHVAASIRFDDTLTYATLMNARGTREIMMIVRNMKNLMVFVHVSTSYSNCDRKVVEEKIYPPHADWREIIKMVETIDEHTLNILTPKILGNIPNTYIFTKSLAEHIVNDLGKNLPVAIVRPSVVISSLNDPIPGWIDTIYGPIGMLMAGGKGIIRSSYANPDAFVDYIPVDVAIKGLIGVAWAKATFCDVSEPTVVNATSGTQKRITMKKLKNLGSELTEEIPLDNIVWRPYGIITNNRYIYYWTVILFHLIPALIIDGLLKVAGKKPMLVKIQARIYTASLAVFHFLNNSWYFKNDNLFHFRDKMHPDDKKEFNVDNIEHSDEKEYFRKAMLGARLYLLKERPENIPQAKKHFKRMVWLDRIVFGLIYTLVIYYIYNSGILQNMFYYINNAVTL